MEKSCFSSFVLTLLVVGNVAFKYDFKLEDNFHQGRELPTELYLKFSELADKHTLLQHDILSLSFEQLINRFDSWFPRIHDYFEKSNVPRDDITKLRNTLLSDVFKLMPKYNITDFWDVSFSGLLNRVRFYMTKEGTQDVLDLMKQVYASQSLVAVTINKFDPKGAYMTKDRAKVFELVKQLQQRQTTMLMQSFGLTEAKLTLVTSDSFETVNNKFSNLIFANIHQDEETIKRSHRAVHKVLKKMQLYRESMYTWSKSCPARDGSIPNQLYQNQTLNEIAERCFDQSFNKLARDFYGVNGNYPKTEQLHVNEAYQILGEKCCQDDLQNASVFIDSVVTKVNKFQEERMTSFIVYARSANYTWEKTNRGYLYSMLPLMHQLPWDVLRKLYELSEPTEIKVKHIPFYGLISTINQLNKVNYPVQQWRIVSLNTLMSALDGLIDPNQVLQEIRKMITKLSENKIKELQNLFGVSSDDLKRFNLFKLSQEYFGLNKSEFLEIYKISSSKAMFFFNASTEDITLLAAPQADVEKFTINQLISVAGSDQVYSNIMILTINTLKGSSSQSTIFELSIPQIVDTYDSNDAVTQESFRRHVEKWSDSKELGTYLIITELKTVATTLNVRQEDLLDMRVIDILAGVLSTFGSECSEEGEFCHALQTCKNTKYGKRCQCDKGFRFTVKDTCTDINECAYLDVTCDQNAECKNTIGSYKCDCNVGFHGNGETCENINECLNGMHNCSSNTTVCQDTIGSYRCTCRPGFTGEPCQNINECNTIGCPDNTICEDTIGSYKCSCRNGFKGDGTYCEDIDECKIDGVCGEHSYCNNTIGSYHCGCKEPYIKKGVKCHECLFNVTQNCHDNATCDVSTSTCKCKTGYRGNGRTCSDVNECRDDFDICGFGRCTNLPGSYTCLCDKGFVLKTVGRKKVTCVDMDECKMADEMGKLLCTGKHQHCKNEFGSYACITERPNTELKIGLGVAIPLVIVLTVLMFAMYYIHRRLKGKKELRSFDDKLRNMYVNHAFDPKDDDGLQPPRERSGTDLSKTQVSISKNGSSAGESNSTTGSHLNLLKGGNIRYIFKKGNYKEDLQK